MALSASCVSNAIAGSTAGNVNGGYFNTANANFVTDYTATDADTDSPVISSATITWDAGDADAYLYVQAGTNWTPGFYKIVSVDTGADTVTLDASVGAAMQLDAMTNRYKPNTVAGCATVASPTGGKCGVSYIHQTVAEIAPTNLASVGASTTVTSASNPFRQTFVGNHLMISTTGTGAFGVIGWYEIVTFVNAGQITTDRTTNSGTAMVAVTGRVGGAISFGSSTTSRTDDSWLETSVAGMRHFVQGGTYSINVTISVAAAGTLTNPIMLTGYTTVWGDSCNDASRPLFSAGGNNFSWTGAQWFIRNIRYTGTVSAGFSVGPSSLSENCQAINTSTTAGRFATTSNTTSRHENCEYISYRGPAISHAAGVPIFMGCVARCSNYGLQFTSTGNQNVAITNCIFAANNTGALRWTAAYTATSFISGNTIAGFSTPRGIGIDISTGNTGLYITNNIIWGFATGINQVDAVKGSHSSYNTFYNNTSDGTNWIEGKSDVFVDPAFTAFTEVAFATATTSGSVITQSGATFVTSGIVAGRDYVLLESGTGITTGYYGITAVTETTITVDIAPGTNATADKVGRVMVGWNLMPTGSV